MSFQLGKAQDREYALQYALYQYELRDWQLRQMVAEILPAIKHARDTHQYYVDNPYPDAWWIESPTQEAAWVKIYDKFIAVLAVIKGK